MKVCMVAYTFYDGDNRVMRYAETLVRRGDQVDVISLRYGNQSSLQVLNGVTVYRVQARRMKEKSRCAYLFRIVLFLFRALFLLARRHLSEPYQLVHVHSMPDFLVFAALVPRLMGCKVVLDIHDLLPDFYAGRFGVKAGSLAYKLLVNEERVSCAFADHIVISNDLWRERVVQRSVEDERCTVIINAVDRSIFHPGPALRCGNKFVVLYPGSLNWHQGVDLAIRAIASIRHQLPEVELQICGLGPEKEALVSLVQELGLGNCVTFLDPRPIREIAQLMRQVDLGVVPKRKDSFGNEAFSTKIMEFMATGIPVVVSDTRIDRFYFDDSIVKFFDGGDSDSLAKSILALAQDRSLRDDLVGNARRFIEHNDWESNQHTYLELVDRLTGNCTAQKAIPAAVA